MPIIHPKKPSFFERLTGGVHIEESRRDEMPIIPPLTVKTSGQPQSAVREEEQEEEGELAVDVYQTPDTIIVKAMIAGVKPDDLDVSITRDAITIKGKRVEETEITGDDYVFRELYWGSFSRSITLPQEIEPEEADAIEKNGLLTIRLPKIDKKKVAKLKVKSS